MHAYFLSFMQQVLTLEMEPLSTFTYSNDDQAHCTLGSNPQISTLALFLDFSDFNWHARAPHTPDSICMPKYKSINEIIMSGQFTLPDISVDGLALFPPS